MKSIKRASRSFITVILTVSASLFIVPSAIADKMVTVNIDNFARAETAMQIDRFLETTGGINKWAHTYQPTPLDKQNVIRMNRDTLYSVAIVDISEGATLTLPDAGSRYMSMMVVNEDHYINNVFHKGGTYELTMEEFGTPYVIIIGRILANSVDPKDIKIANALQDKMKIDAVSAKPYTHPNYDKASYNATYKPLLELSMGLPGTENTFGKKEEVTEARHLLGSAFGWGGLPVYEAFYVNEGELRDAGETQLTVKDVPVDAFWSISIYNKEGYFEENEFDSYSINNLTAKPNKDGSVTINFGTDPTGKDNFLYVMDGWNYTVRLYQPREEIQNGEWSFPKLQPVK